MIKKIFQRAAVVALFLPALGYSIDHFTPAWRGEPGTTYQRWEFTATPTNYNGDYLGYYGPEVTPPDASTNAFGTAQAAFNDLTASGGIGWKYDPLLSATLRGWWDLGFGAAGTITLTIPNSNLGIAYTRVMVVQVTEAYGGPGIDFAAISVSGGTQIGSVVRFKSETQGSPPNDVSVSQTVWQVPANTSANIVTITGSSTAFKDSVIDSLVVDTIADRAPIPGAKQAATTENIAASIYIHKLVGAATDPDVGDIVTFVAPMSLSASNGTVVTNILDGVPSVTYTPPLNFTGTDYFYYTITDGKATSTGTVTVTVKPATGITFNMLPLVISNSLPFVQFAGVRGHTYELQRSPTLAPADWTTIATIFLPANGNGIGSFYDSDAPGTNAFYRTHLP